VKSSQEPGRNGFSWLEITREHLGFRDEFRGKQVTPARRGTTVGTKPRRRLCQGGCWRLERHGDGCFRFLGLGLSFASFRCGQTLGAEGLQSPIVPAEPKNLAISHNLQLELQARG